MLDEYVLQGVIIDILYLNNGVNVFSENVLVVNVNFYFHSKFKIRFKFYVFRLSKFASFILLCVDMGILELNTEGGENVARILKIGILN